MPGPLVPISVNGYINISFTAFDGTNTVTYTITGVEGGPLTDTVVVNCISPVYPIVCSIDPVLVTYNTLQCEPIVVSGTVTGSCEDNPSMTISFEEIIEDVVILCDGNYTFTCNNPNGCATASTGEICPRCPNFDNVPANVEYDPNGAVLQTYVKNPLWIPDVVPGVVSYLPSPKIPYNAQFGFCPSEIDWFLDHVASSSDWSVQANTQDNCCIECEQITVVIYNWVEVINSIPPNGQIPQMFYTRCPSLSDNSSCYRRQSVYFPPSTTPDQSGHVTIATGLCVVKGSVSFLGFDPNDVDVCSITYTSSSICPS